MGRCKNYVGGNKGSIWGLHVTRCWDSSVGFRVVGRRGLVFRGLRLRGWSLKPGTTDGDSKASALENFWTLRWVKGTSCPCMHQVPCVIGYHQSVPRLRVLRLDSVALRARVSGLGCQVWRLPVSRRWLRT